MRYLLFFAMFWPALAIAQGVKPGPITPTAWDDYRRAAELFNAGARVQAGCVMYRGQFRARLMLLADPDQSSDGGPALFASLNETVARPINQWLGGDRDDWIAALECARKWAAENDDPAYPRGRFGAIHANVLAGLDELIAAIPPKSELRAQRRSAGLPNR
ncbi:hypothetical protein [uncultured Tateyamaria sp.]|uniref:hypothetical protein n=1 Tax=uncultured Tateyamaria sp. TaxID=455651 RepID=UPI0026178C50|nr:hypothetical protein [uncultured Tateyamaria sp.]